MGRETFRQDFSSAISVPGDGRTTKGTEAAKSVAAIVQALRFGSSLTTSSDVAKTLPQAEMQWVVVQSAGSTGVPKTLRRSPASWMASFEVTRAYFGVSETAPYAVLGALEHSLSLYAVLEALHLGCDLAVLTGMAPRAQLDELRDNDIQVLYATPTQLRLLTAGRVASLPALKWIFSGGGKLDVGTRVALRDLAPNAVVREFFGASETSFMTITDDATPDGSVGRAYPHVDLRVLDVAGYETDQPGEIWVKSPYLFDSYIEGENHATAWRDGYLSIGEMGQLDADGNLFVLGRKSRMVTVSDHNVFPELVEAALQKTANVEKCAALAVRDPKRGHLIVGIVEGRQDAELAKSMIGSCRATLGAHAAPRQIFFVDQMPLLPAGKPDLKRLAQIIEHLI